MKVEFFDGLRGSGRVPVGVVAGAADGGPRELVLRGALGSRRTVVNWNIRQLHDAADGDELVRMSPRHPRLWMVEA